LDSLLVCSRTLRLLWGDVRAVQDATRAGAQTESEREYCACGHCAEPARQRSVARSLRRGAVPVCLWVA